MFYCTVSYKTRLSLYILHGTFQKARGQTQHVLSLPSSEANIKLLHDLATLFE